MSLLLSQGHSEATSYPVGMITDEASIVAERLQIERASDAIIHQATLGTVPNMGVKPSTTRKGIAAFQKMIKRLTGSDHGE